MRQFKVINMISKKVYTVNDLQLENEDIHKILEFTPFGHSLSDRKLIEIMGKNDFGNFLKDRVEYYE